MSLFVVFMLMEASCQHDEEHQTFIMPIELENDMRHQLDSIFSSENTCLINFSNDTVFHFLFSEEDFRNVDECNEITEIDFNKYTLVVGKIQVASINDSIFDIELFEEDKKYKIEIKIEKCTECYGAIGQLYFWRLYPDLSPYYEKNILVTEK